MIAVLSNLRLALSLGGGYSVLAFTFSGLTFPIMAMWPAMRVVSRFFPFTYYTDVFVDQALRGAPVRCSLPTWAAWRSSSFYRSCACPVCGASARTKNSGGGCDMNAFSRLGRSSPPTGISSAR